MEPIANLGTVAVLDADNLLVGHYMEIEKQLFIVTKIDGINVFFRPLTRWEMWKYRWGKARLIVKLAIFVAVVIVGALLLLAVLNIGGHSNAGWK